MLRQFERDLFPWIGERRIADIRAMELLAVLQKVEERWALETADRALMLARQVWDYWLWADYLDYLDKLVKGADVIQFKAA